MSDDKGTGPVDAPPVPDTGTPKGKKADVTPPPLPAGGTSHEAAPADAGHTPPPVPLTPEAAKKAAEEAAALAAKTAAKGTGYGRAIAGGWKGDLFHEIENTAENPGARQAAYKALNPLKKAAAGISTNLGKGGLTIKARTAGTVAGMVYFGGSLINDGGRWVGVIPLKKDETTGQEIPVNFGTVAVDVAGLVGTTAFAALGGHKRAIAP